jgi:hypothetical protein
LSANEAKMFATPSAVATNDSEGLKGALALNGPESVKWKDGEME